MIKPYKQTLSNGCLPASLLMLLQSASGKKISSTAEEKICLRGSRRTHPFYVSGVPYEFSNQFRLGLTVFADNKFFAAVLKKALKGHKRSPSSTRK